MNQCSICEGTLHDAQVVCAGCGEVLPLRVVVVSEGSRGGGFALVENADLNGWIEAQDEWSERAGQICKNSEIEINLQNGWDLKEKEASL